MYVRVCVGSSVYINPAYMTKHHLWKQDIQKWYSADSSLVNMGILPPPSSDLPDKRGGKEGKKEKDKHRINIITDNYGFYNYNDTLYDILNQLSTCDECIIIMNVGIHDMTTHTLKEFILGTHQYGAANNNNRRELKLKSLLEESLRTKKRSLNNIESTPLQKEIPQFFKDDQITSLKMNNNNKKNNNNNNDSDIYEILYRMHKEYFTQFMKHIQSLKIEKRFIWVSGTPYLASDTNWKTDVDEDIDDDNVNKATTIMKQILINNNDNNNKKKKDIKKKHPMNSMNRRKTKELSRFYRSFLYEKKICKNNQYSHFLTFAPDLYSSIVHRN
jgi:hypothetical protein